MSLVVLENVGLGFAGRSLFEELNFRVGEEDRIGVIGRNGSGKSSLFRVIAGTHEPNAGAVRKARGLRIGYLPQELEVQGGATLLASVENSVPGKAALERMLGTVETELAEAEDESDQMALAQKLADLHEDLRHFDSAYSRHEALRILAGLGFKQTDIERDVGELSGGWRMRAVLAGLLFQRPDLLLLDEPTNHLDVPSVAWLATFLRQHKGAMMLICHDREFLNEQIERVVSFETEGVRQYAGDHTAYLEARAEDLKVLERRAANVAREKDAAERFIRRFRAQATKARAVQSRIKAVERMDEIVLPSSQRTLAFRFPPSQRAGHDVIRLEGVGHSYGDHRVFSGVDLTVRRGDRIGIVGANGNGKTTLLKIMADVLAPSNGHARLGHNAKIAYYAQHVTEQLDTRSTVVDEVWRSSAVDDMTQVRGALGTMMFSGDDVDKVIGVLSGGEKARVALARLMVDPGNAILMDEPTNHLDLESSEALAAALETFDGTLVFVSHNRSFARRLARTIWCVEEGRVAVYPGTFSEYVDHCARTVTEEAETDAGLVSGAAGNAQAGTRRAEKPAKARSPKRRRAGAGGSKALERKVADLERRIAELEREQAERTSELSLPETYSDEQRYGDLLRDYRTGAAKLDELVARWERAQEELIGLAAPREGGE